MKMTNHSRNRRLFPWSKLRKGQGFFIPCLATKQLKIEGLQAAVSQQILNAKAYPAIRDGLLGVWFYRPKPKN